MSYRVTCVTAGSLYLVSVLLVIFIILAMIGIGEMYRFNHKMNSYGIDGYQVEKKYEETNKVLREKNRVTEKDEARKKETKRGHYLEDYAKIHGEVPGPGVYDCEVDAWKKSQKSSKRKVKPTKKQTFIEELMEREKKQNLPAPGQYKLFQSEADINAEKKRLAHRKISHGQRCTYLDAVQYEASITPGVGSYNPNFLRPKSATHLNRNKNANFTSRPNSTTKKREAYPESGTYNPKTVEDHKSFSRKSKGYHEWGRVQRFKSEKKESKLGPGCYAFDERMAVRKSGKSVYYN